MHENLEKYFNSFHNTPQGYIRQNDKFYITNMYSAVRISKIEVRRLCLKELLGEELLNGIDYNSLMECNIFVNNKIRYDKSEQLFFIDGKVNNTVVAVVDSELNYTAAYLCFNHQDIVFNEVLLTNLFNILPDGEYFYTIESTRMIIYNKSRSISAFILGIKNPNKEDFKKYDKQKQTI